MSSSSPEVMPPGPPVQGWVQMKPCARCGQAIDPTKAVYSKQGELVCKGCESADILEDGYSRAAKSSCLGALGTGVLSVFFNPYFIFSILAVTQGVRAIVLINRPEYKSMLKGRYAGYLIAAIGGILAGLVQPALYAMALLLAGAAATIR